MMIDCVMIPGTMSEYHKFTCKKLPIQNAMMKQQCIDTYTRHAQNDSGNHHGNGRSSSAKSCQAESGTASWKARPDQAELSRS